jgi:hypothetical protein
MKVEITKTLSTYVIALVVIIGGGALLVIPTQVDPEALLPFLTGTVGAVIAYVFADRQTATVQKGNGLERTELAELRRDVSQLLGGAIIPGSAGAFETMRQATGMTAEKVDLEADHVEVHPA